QLSFSILTKSLSNSFDLSPVSSMLDEKDFARQLEIKIWDKLSKFDWMPFEEARNYMHSKRLRNSIEWMLWSASKNRPINIPSNPGHVYKNEGYVNLGDWLGTGNIAPKDMYEYLPFDEAKRSVHKLGLTRQVEWVEYCKSGQKAGNIPGTPERAYKNKGWVNFGDWLGTRRVATREMVFRPFIEAREFARSLGLTRQVQWFEYCKSGQKPQDIPTSPRETYTNQFKSYGDWLGTGRIGNKARKYASFNDARDYARGLSLSGKLAWGKWSAAGKRPLEIPGNPRKVYKEKGWSGWADWLGTGNKHPSQKMKLYCDFFTARKYVRKLNLTSVKEFVTFCKSDKKPEFIPPWPAQTYKGQWINWIDFLGKDDLEIMNEK
ncbi:MAG: hypothetical protein O2852_02815, partial [Bacteroidetes bacterium]|nr:hypothetical protein [Bacteroidota bacterium]